MDKLNTHREYSKFSYTTKKGKKVSFNIPSGKYLEKLLYICSECGHAIFIGDFEQSGKKHPRHLKKVY